MPVLEIAGLAKRFPPGEAVLAHLDFCMRPGEAVALVGRSGSGKTTLLNVIAGLEPIDAGSIHVGGCAVQGLSDRRASMLRKTHLGIVFQSYNLLPTLTVAENLAFPLALIKRRDPQRVQTLLEQIGLERHAQRMPATLSGGEQQRLAVARALVHRPKLVLADEPTGSLDLDNARRIVALLLQTCREQRAGLLLVTHSSETSSQLDRVVRIEDGRLVAVAASA